MDEEYHARCNYCGTTKSHRWIKNMFGLYCSSDCFFASQFWAFTCGLFMTITMSLLLLQAIGTYAFPVVFILSLFSLIFLLFIIRGVQARKRVSRQTHLD